MVTYTEQLRLNRNPPSIQIPPVVVDEEEEIEPKELSYTDSLRLKRNNVLPGEITTPVPTQVEIKPLNYTENLRERRGTKTLKNEGGPQEFINLELILKDYTDEDGDTSLVKEQILEDSRLMEIVYQSLEARNQPSSFAGAAYKGASALSTGEFLPGADTGASVFGPRNYRKMGKEEAFEMYQNYQRSFAGGQSITTLNELTYIGMSEDNIKAKLGAGYMLFDSMDNAFIGKGSTSEMFDAIYDYTRAALVDPATIFTFGLGKVFQAGAGKVGTTLARNSMVNVYKQAIAKGMTSTAARKVVSDVIVKSSAYTASEAVINMGIDVAYQNTLMTAGTQEEYSIAQGAFAAAGAMIIPAAVAFGRGVGAVRKKIETTDSNLLKSVAAYNEIDTKVMNLDSAKAKTLIKNKVRTKYLIDTINETFGKVKGDTRKFLGWSEIKAEAKGGITLRKEEYTDDDAMNSFYKYFWFGSADGKRKGYFETLQEAGFVVHASMLHEKQIAIGATVGAKDVKKIGKVTDVDFDTATVQFKNTDTGEINTSVYNLEDLNIIKPAKPGDVKRINTITGIYGQAMRFLDDKTAANLITRFESETGLSLSGIQKTSKGLSDHFIDRARSGGETLAISSQLAALNKKNFKAAEAIKAMTPEMEGTNPKRLAFALSVYKRLLTAHPSTTGTNIRGFTQLVGINTLADVATGTINAGQGAWYKYFNKNTEEATKYFNRSQGSFLGAMRRGVAVFSPDLEIDYANKILELNPKTAEKLFRDIAGDGGVNDSFKHFDLLNKDGKVPVGYKAMDAVTRGAQTVAMVRVQDQLTKLWSFSTNLNQAIMREYGISPSKFYENAEEAAITMASDRFKTNVLEKATFRTLRETASVNWSTLPAQGFMRGAAKFIEKATNRSPVGFLVPFGSFLNTTLATAADLSGVNAARTVLTKVMGKEPDFATQEGAEAFGKMAAGWTLFTVGMYGADGAIQRVREGLGWEQSRRDDGSIQDRRFDWPDSTIRVVTQILGHASQGGKLTPSQILKGMALDPKVREEIPSELWRELAMQVGGQAIRDLDDFGKSLLSFAKDFSDGEDVSESGQALLIELAARPLSGLTRPLEPLNVAVGLYRDSNMLPDLRQGPKFLNQSMKYVNNLFTGVGSSASLPERNSVTKGPNIYSDTGKIMFGGRSSRENNLIESMLNSAGRPNWKTVRFDGPPEVKNYMDALVYPNLNVAARRAIKAYPDFFDASKTNQKKKEDIVDKMLKEAKELTLNIVKNSSVPKSLELVRTLSGKNKDDVKKVMNLLQIEGSLTDLLDQPDALEQLQKIEILLESGALGEISFN
jgi:hypothetical protein